MYDLKEIEFKDEKRFLSNMFIAPIIFNFDIVTPSGVIKGDGRTYPSSEHIYQALKSENPHWHSIIYSMVRPENTKTAAKHALKTLMANNINTFLIRDDWHDIKLSIMEKLVQEKFKQNPELMEKLKLIPGPIQERNCWGDKYWGTVKGFGENHLGKILMLIRDEND